MWEATELGNEDLLWATIAFNGGIAGQQEAVCGAVSASAVYLGLRYRCPTVDKQLADIARRAARKDARKVVDSFASQFGTIICKKLLGIDFSDNEDVQRFRSSGEWQRKCDMFAQFIIEKLYELEAK
ncbi:MAG: C-GCAxxG-C-C family protein [Dehalococcoidales bacterium]|nr:C-GCAxxG-C-C family protein [Dehalococcoidales bacterium]